MSIESILFFILALFVWGLSAAARWFQEQMNRHSTDGIEFEPIDWSSEPELEPVPKVQSLEAPILKKQPSRPIPERGSLVRQQKTVNRFGLDKPQTLRQGIILMTVLGPCRALESSSDTRPS